jgi:hypothetical protein
MWVWVLLGVLELELEELEQAEELGWTTGPLPPQPQRRWRGARGCRVVSRRRCGRRFMDSAGDGSGEEWKERVG